MILTQTVPGGYGLALLQMLVALAAVCFLIWFVLRFMATRGIGRYPSHSQNLQVIERLNIDAQHSLVVTKVGKRILVLGIADGASPALICELDDAEVEIATADQPRSFASILAQISKRSSSSASSNHD